MTRKPLPQFNSHDEAFAFYSKYGRMEYFGRIDDFYVYKLHLIDGRKLSLWLYLDGRVVDNSLKR